MKKRKRVLIMAAALWGVICLGACGKAEDVRNMEMMAETSAASSIYSSDTNTMAEQEMVDKMAQDTGEGGTLSEQMSVSERKLIKSVSMTVETEEFDGLMANVQSKVESNGGYIENSDVYTSRMQVEEGNRSASLTLRIPEEKLNSFVDEMAGISNIIQKSENVQDVTLQYVDVESHKKALQMEQERLLQLLEQAETMEDLIAIEGRLSEVRYQLQSYESQLRIMDNQVSYSTIQLEIREVKRLTPKQEQGIFERIGVGFVDSLVNLTRGIKEFFIGFIVIIPYLIFWGAILCFVVFAVTRILKKRNKIKKPEKEDKNKRDEKETQ